jgi:hypothetical protein
MKFLSIRQPWAYAIMHLGKDIENRSWSTKFRGRILVHASLNWDGHPSDALDDLRGWSADAQVEPPPSIESVKRGGFVGSVEIVDCVTESSSRWFEGAFGFVLRDPRPMDFIPARGQLGFGTVPQDVMAIIGSEHHG